MVTGAAHLVLKYEAPAVFAACDRVVSLSLSSSSDLTCSARVWPVTPSPTIAPKIPIIAARPWLIWGREERSEGVKGTSEASAIEGQKGKSVLVPQDSLLAAVS